MRLARLAALVVLLIPVQAWAFDWLGLRSGMTVDQVRAAAPAGSALRLNGDFGVIEKDGGAVATVTFCKGRLIALSRTIDVQTDWFTLADRMIKQYGRPKVTPASDPWAGPKASVGTGLEMSWRSGSNKYALTSYPAAQPGRGRAQASLSVADLGPVNACVPRHAAARPQTRKASFVHHVKRQKPLRQPSLPPIGGARLNLTPAAPPSQVQAKAAPAPRASNAAPREMAVRDPAAPVDPASVRGRILRFFSAFRARPKVAEDTQEN